MNSFLSKQKKASMSLNGQGHRYTHKKCLGWFWVWEGCKIDYVWFRLRIMPVTKFAVYHTYIHIVCKYYILKKVLKC